MPDPLSAMPDKIRLGDTLDVLFSFSDFDASDGWTITIYWIGAITDFSKVTSASGIDHLLELTATETNTNLKVEQMSWQAKATKGADVFTADFGTQDGLVNFTTASASDQRTENQIILDAVEARINDRASTDQNEYTIKDRQLKLMTIDELISWQSIYTNRVKLEKRKEKGQGTQLIKVRFKRP